MSQAAAVLLRRRGGEPEPAVLLRERGPDPAQGRQVPLRQKCAGSRPELRQAPARPGGRGLLLGRKVGAGGRIRAGGDPALPRGRRAIPALGRHTRQLAAARRPLGVRAAVDRVQGGCHSPEGHRGSPGRGQLRVSRGLAPAAPPPRAASSSLLPRGC